MISHSFWYMELISHLQNFCTDNRILKKLHDGVLAAKRGNGFVTAVNGHKGERKKIGFFSSYF